MRSLPDAEILENIAEDLVGGDGLAEDGAKGFDGVAEVLGDKVGGALLIEAFADAEQGSAGNPKGFQVADVGNQGLVGTFIIDLPV